MATCKRLDWDWDSRFARVQAAIQEASEDALEAAADKALADADVPVRSGALKRSGRADVAFPVAVVHFGSTGSDPRGRGTEHYAIPQHQRYDYTHPRGGSARFLEYELSPGRRLYEVMADRIRRVIEGKK
ncbi:hypothetical protein OU415_02310 [Saccharopolyspora sp. WRP15-2]|uniref:HK97 gp10 family phage protein n=1 Tax=Saccharopolyspora oryzae TaxID=2997343 RepID=A0ABT4URA5_9PSEU|nr:hypothetical protein [Saccharopolyspora oryzae]MDA3624250.1 hypothetical protein [Saccharopolyspora oryzae]